jgi:putative transposase
MGAALFEKTFRKGSRKMLDEFGELRWQFCGQHLWARGYFIASSGNVTDEIIAQYIEMQNDKPQNDREDFQVGEL